MLLQPHHPDTSYQGVRCRFQFSCPSGDLAVFVLRSVRSGWCICYLQTQANQVGRRMPVTKIS